MFEKEFYDKLVIDVANKVIEIQAIGQVEKKMDLDKYPQSYKVKEVAKITEKHESTIREHIAKGLLKAKKIGKQWTVTHENLEKYISPNV
jgi:excisionase family DNA binding protein